MRTSFKHHQLRVMKTYFELNHNPDAKDLKQLSQKTGLSKRVLQVWFQNARAKYRRNQSTNEPNNSNAATPTIHHSSGNNAENVATVNSLSSLSTSSNSSSTNSTPSQNILIQQLNGYNNNNSIHSHQHHHLHQLHHSHHNIFSNEALNELDLIGHANQNCNNDDNSLEFHESAQSRHSIQQALGLQNNDDLLIN